MKKVLVLICTILVSIVVASLYGALHNQLTFTISNEFFTEVLFERFGFVEYGLNTPRLTASIIGIWSVWWIGLYAGLVFGIIGLFFTTAKDMMKNIVYAIVIMLITSILVGFIGLSYGFLGFSNLEKVCWFPLMIVNEKNFIAASEMHSFSYAGGAIGTFLGALWQLKKLIKDRFKKVI